MASELSREQVELMQKTVAMGYGLTLDCADAQQLLDTYAALREHLGQLEHENKNLLTCQCEQCDGSLLEDAVCRKCFAALTAKLAELNGEVVERRACNAVMEAKLKAVEQERDKCKLIAMLCDAELKREIIDANVLRQKIRDLPVK